ncbi:HutP family protein [Microvirga sp. W0021]|uniref:Hut operon positive regulatory protein n=1 Tax=Hohaiivirga grylli TaxID=3133970 RepID=A0ABV0BQ00_9HYPH
MEIKLTRIGKIAILAALSDESEEETIKADVLAGNNNIRLAVTFISGTRGKINETFTRNILNAAIQNNVIRKTPGQMHAVLHAALEALQGVTPQTTSVSSSVKVKVAICTDGVWLAVAAYGDSAVSPFTNHERCGFGIMHL